MNFTLISKFFKRAVLPAVVVVLAAACSRQPAAPTTTEVEVPLATTAEQTGMVVDSFSVSPAIVHKGSAATVAVKARNAEATPPLTVSWFGVDGWNVIDQNLQLSGGAATAPAPTERFTRAGQYHAQLRSGLRNLAEASLTVED